MAVWSSGSRIGSMHMPCSTQQYQLPGETCDLLSAPTNTCPIVELVLGVCGPLFASPCSWRLRGLPGLGLAWVATLPAES